MNCPKCNNTFEGTPAECPHCGQPFQWTAPSSATASAATSEAVHTEQPQPEKTATTVASSKPESSDWLNKFWFVAKNISVIPIIGTIISFIILSRFKDYKTSLNPAKRKHYKAVQKAHWMHTIFWGIVILIIVIGLFIAYKGFSA